MQTALYTSPTTIPNEVETIIQLFENGLDYLYIRKPELDEFLMVDFVEKIPEKYWTKTISTSLIITKEFNLAGYHFTRDNIQKNSLYNEKILKWLHDNNKISSISAHHIEEINTYLDKFRHVIVSPIFPSISKKNYEYKWNYTQLKKTISNKKKSILIATGGVEKGKINTIKKLGFDAVGLLGTIWNSNSPIQNFISIRQEINP